MMAEESFVAPLNFAFYLIAQRNDHSIRSELRGRFLVADQVVMTGHDIGLHLLSLFGELYLELGQSENVERRHQTPHPKPAP